MSAIREQTRNVCTEGRSFAGNVGIVSVGSTLQTTDIALCCRHVEYVGSTRWRHSVMLDNFLAVCVMSVRLIANTQSCMHVGISTSEVFTYSSMRLEV